ncbi:MAG: STAS domain-containing protein [Micromonosporaceae bacterium]|jgi:anti-anti-sigma factor|nr:STAS domain-containing protein [Micromonosporaceae bacterium]
MSTISIHTRQFGQAQLVRVAGSVDFASVASLRELLSVSLRQHKRYVVLDLSGVTLLDAHAGGVLRRLATDSLSANGSRLHAIGATGMVLEVLRITGAAKPLGIICN